MPSIIAPCAALAISALAALHDSRSGTIPNWITLPPVALAPFFYGFFLDPDLGFRSLAGIALCGFVPYWLFCRGAMGGGDVKLFAGLGATMGFDLRAGLEIQLSAIVVGMCLAFVATLVRGQLGPAFRRVARNGLRFLHPAAEALPKPARGTPIRLGVPVFAGTVLVVAPYLASLASLR